MDPARPTPDDPEVGPRLELALRLADEAGALLLDRAGRFGAVTRKGAVDLMTEADQASEALIRDAIAARFPEDAILAEEGGRSGRGASAWTWVVDPLDGTTNYVHGLRHYAVSIGLARGDEPVAGVIRAPAYGDTWHGWDGGGAWCGAAPMAVSRTASLDAALLATGFPYDRRETAEALLRPVRRALESCRGLRRMGAATLDFVGVAQGVFDGFWEARLAPWDMAAGAALVRAAGGRVCAWGGRPFALRGDTVLCSNGQPGLHDALVALVGDGA